MTVDAMRRDGNIARRPSRGRAPKRRTRTRLAEGPAFWLLPSIAVLLLVTLYPMVYSLINSFRSYNLSISTTPGNFLGWLNYANAWSDGEFRHSLWISFVFALVATGVEVLLGLAIALLLNQQLRGVHAIRSLLILPVAVAPAVAGLAFRSLYDPNSGAVPYLLHHVGVETPPAGILGSGSTALAGVIATDVWEWTPFAALVFLAAMQGISKDVLEAARVDGARPARTFFSVTLPLIQPVIVIVLLLRFIASFNIFDILFVQTGGGPGFSTTTSGIYIYQSALSNYNIGYASALTWIITVIVAVLINAYLFATRKMSG